MRKRVFISAIGASLPDSMGGNTKIIIELINNLLENYDFFIFTYFPKTFELNIKEISKIKVIDLNIDKKKITFVDLFFNYKYVINFFNNYFFSEKLTEYDYFLSLSDCAPDVLPVCFLKKKYKFKWISTLFLFIPNPVEIIKKKYYFPFFKYLFYFIYQRFLFSKIVNLADFFIITNDIDKKYFPKKLHKYILAIYGGINSEQITEAKRIIKKIEYDAVFCSRLHPQKGISRLLEVWSFVVKRFPDAILAIIGNGDIKYEKFLKTKAEKLNINKNLIWFGYINDVAKYEIYLKSKIFLHSTIYDNNGMVAAEALCSGLPVIMYDLENFRDLYNKGCVKVKEGAIKEYSDCIIKMLTDDKYYFKIKPDESSIRELTEFWKWQTRSKIFRNFIDKNLERHYI